MDGETNIGRRSRASALLKSKATSLRWVLDAALLQKFYTCILGRRDISAQNISNLCIFEPDRRKVFLIHAHLISLIFLKSFLLHCSMNYFVYFAEKWEPFASWIRLVLLVWLKSFL